MEKLLPVLLYCMWFAYCKDNVKFVENAYTRNEAATFCQIFGTKRTDSINDVVFAREDVQPGLAWIGAKTRYTSWITFHGCYSISRSEIVKSSSSSDNQVRTCMESCKESSYFSLRGSYCFCLSSNTQRRSSQLIPLSPCRGNKDDFCGDEISPFSANGMIIDAFVYSKVDFPVTSGACLTANKNGARYNYHPANCEERHSVICKYSYYTEDGYNYLNIYIGYMESYCTWTEAIAVCYSKSTTAELGRRSFLSDIYDISVTSSNEFIPNNKSLWIGIFRKEYYDWQQDKGADNCVAANISEDGSFVPLKVDCGLKLPVVCDIISTPTTSHSTSSSSSIVIGTSVGIGLILLLFGGMTLFIYFYWQKEPNSSHSKLIYEQDLDSEPVQEPETGQSSHQKQAFRQRKVSFHLTKEQYDKCLAERGSNEYDGLNEGNRIYKEASDLNIYDHVAIGDEKNEENIYDHCRRSERVPYDPAVYDHIGSLQMNISVGKANISTQNKENVMALQNKNNIVMHRQEESAMMQCNESMTTDNKTISKAQPFVVGEPDNYNSILIPGEVDDYSFLENTADGLWKFKE